MNWPGLRDEKIQGQHMRDVLGRKVFAKIEAYVQRAQHGITPSPLAGGPGAAAARIAAGVLLWLGDLVTDDAADRRSSRGSQKTAADDVTRNAADDGTGGGALLLPCHPATTAQADQDYRCNCADYSFLHRFHLHASMSNID